MLSRVLRTIRRHQLLVGSDANRILCAVSGGPDSMALLGCLWELAPRLRLTLEVVTVDHGLRPEAAREIAMVQERSAALGLPWHCVRVDVAASRRKGQGPPGGERGGVQEVARRLRLAALAELAARRGLGRVALGHQADDQSETVLFRILRGTGIAGLSGIPYLREPFVRPLLDVTRTEIQRYLNRRSLPSVTDPSNADLRYARARLRHRVLPLLRQENPRVDQALRSLAAIVAAARRDTMVSEILSGARDADVHLPTRVVNEIALAAREGVGTRSFDVAGRRRVTVAYGQVRFEATDSSLPVGRGSIPSVQIDGPGTHSFGTALAVVVRETQDPERPDPKGKGAREHLRWAWFDGDQLSWPLRARPRRPGDRMRPRGGTGSRKLSDLLIDAKIPRLERGSLPVVTAANGELLFVPGIRPAGGATPSPTTRRWIGLAVVAISDHDASG
jgi:tRNA(Ile)-lysidine synthase